MRCHWLYEILMDNPLRNDASFIECGRLYVLQGVLNQQSWRVGQLLNQLWVYVQNYLTHPYQNVRDRISSLLTNITEVDVRFELGMNEINSPRLEDVVDLVEGSLIQLLRLKDFDGSEENQLDEDQKEEKLKLMKTGKLQKKKG